MSVADYINHVVDNASGCCSQRMTMLGWVMSLARGAKNNGAKIFEKCAVTGIDAGS